MIHVVMGLAIKTISFVYTLNAYLVRRLTPYPQITNNFGIGCCNIIDMQEKAGIPHTPGKV